jgi:hypothetical protein
MKASAGLLVFFILLSYSGLAQKHFEGQIEVSNVWTNLPANSRGANYTTVLRFKKDKRREESNYDGYSSKDICDYKKNLRVVIVSKEVKAGVWEKNAWIYDLLPSDKTPLKEESYRNILGQKCQKATLSDMTDGKEPVTTVYLSDTYLVNANPGPAGPAYRPLYLASNRTYANGRTHTTECISIKEQNISDDVFEMKIPEGYVINNKSTHTISDLTSKDPFEGLGDNEIKKMMEDAVKKEDYVTADQAKKELAQRVIRLEGEYAGQSTADLKKKMDEAVKAENYTEADRLKKIIDHRSKQ